jgi:DNA polymerase elongation subunit (family B)
MSQLINTQYFYKNRDNDFDKVMFITKEEDGTKKCNIIEKPTIEYYVTKPEFWDGKQRNYIEEDKVIPIKCYNKDLYKSIIGTLNDRNLQNYFYECIQSGSQIGQKLGRIHLDYRIHGSDINIQDYYISQYLKKHPYQDNSFKLTKCVFDIEVDGSQVTGFPNPEDAEAAVNIITLIDMNKLDCYTFCLKYDTETYKKAMAKLDQIKIDLHAKYGEKLKGRKLNYIVKEFDDELDLLKAFYNTINEDIKPDFVLAWNGHGFDNPYLMNRIIRLGGNIEQIMCPKEMKYKKVSYRKDFRNQDPADNSSEMTIVGWSIWLDAMNVYANLRKGMGKEESYSLDYIGAKEVGLTKDTVEESIKTFHFADYEKFFFYNIQDTVMMMLMEEKNQDVDMLYAVSMITQTRIEKAMKKTTCLRNLASQFYTSNKCIISNNRAKLRNAPEGKIKGAFVADPNLIDFIGINLMGQLSRFIFENCIDFDLSSLYPSIILALNISPETCYGKLFLDDAEGNDVSNDFIDAYTSKDFVNLGHEYFGLDDLDEAVTAFKDFKKVA